jgi:hypothetical protein
VLVILFLSLRSARVFLRDGLRCLHRLDQRARLSDEVVRVVAQFAATTEQRRAAGKMRERRHDLGRSAIIGTFPLTREASLD